MKKVVLGFLGTRLDASGASEKRWEHWRPSVALFGHPNQFKADRLELFYNNPSQLPLAERVARDIQQLDEAAQVTAHLLPIADPWNFQEVYASLHEFSKSYEFRDDTEYFVHLTTGTHVEQICLFLLTEARYFPAKLLETFSHGAEAEKWRGSLELIDLNVSAYDQLAQRFKAESLDSQALLKNGITTQSPSFNALIQRVERVALRSSAPILLTGPTGAGKSQLASRIYHLRSKRHQVEGAFVEVNCATLRGDNAMSALFGHKRGAFTGATSDRAGLLKAADKGILFLDEVGTLGLDEQAMLLRALEDKRFTPLGADSETGSDFQLIAGTNLDLHAAVAAGTFRADLLARINLWHFELPGLAQRLEDLAPNIDFELARASGELGTRTVLSKEALAAYLEFGQTYCWPGNFRDLSSSITRMATLCEGGRITLDDVTLEIAQLRQNAGMAAPLANALEVSSSRVRKVLAEEACAQLDPFDEAQLEYVLGVIAQTRSMAEAGRMLFAVSRQQKANPNDSDRLRKYLARWQLTYAQVSTQLRAP